jgi:hypothetical protein
MKRICVFCGSGSGHNGIYAEAAINLANIITKKKIKLVYGGGKVGLMGVIADQVLKNKGKVTGVIPHFLAEKEVGHDKLTEMIFVDSMHERKQKMSELADAFIALPGGFGTLEELAEIITWAQLGLIKKPIGILNVRDFFTPLLNQFDRMVEEGFLKTENRNLLIADANPESLILNMEKYTPIFTPKYLSGDET